MSKWAIVFNHDYREYSVYPELEGGKLKQEQIYVYEKEGIQVDLKILDAATGGEALQAAEAMNKNGYKEVPDTLSRYLVYRMGKTSVEKI